MVLAEYKLCGNGDLFFLLCDHEVNDVCCLIGGLDEEGDRAASCKLKGVGAGYLVCEEAKVLTEGCVGLAVCKGENVLACLGSCECKRDLLACLYGNVVLAEYKLCGNNNFGFFCCALNYDEGGVSLVFVCSGRALSCASVYANGSACGIRPCKSDGGKRGVGDHLVAVCVNTGYALKGNGELYVVTEIGVLNVPVINTCCCGVAVYKASVLSAFNCAGNTELGSLCLNACEGENEVYTVEVMLGAVRVVPVDGAFILDYLIEEVDVGLVCCDVNVESRFAILVTFSSCGKVTLCEKEYAVCVCLVDLTVNCESSLACVDLVDPVACCGCGVSEGAHRRSCGLYGSRLGLRGLGGRLLGRNYYGCGILEDNVGRCLLFIVNCVVNGSVVVNVCIHSGGSCCLVCPESGDSCNSGECDHLIAVVIRSLDHIEGEGELNVVTLRGVLYEVVVNTVGLHYGSVVDNCCSNAALNTTKDVELVVGCVSSGCLEVDVGVSTVFVPGGLVVGVVEDLLVLYELVEEVNVCLISCDVEVEVRAGGRNVTCCCKNDTILVSCVLLTVNGESSCCLGCLVDVSAVFSCACGSCCLNRSVNDDNLVLLSLCGVTATLSGSVLDCGVGRNCCVSALLSLSDGARAHYCEEAEHVAVGELRTIELELNVVTNVGKLNVSVSHTFGKNVLAVVDLDRANATLCFAGDSGLDEACGIACKAVYEVCAVNTVPSGCISKADDSLVLDYVEAVYIVSICCHVEVECVLCSIGVLACMRAVRGEIILCSPRETVCVSLIHNTVNSESFCACVESVGVSAVIGN